MIEMLELTNLKSFSKTEEIKFGRMTLLCGSNSSGKSSILQSLLMLSQTFSARQSSNSIVLNGHLARLGAFEDIKSHHSEADYINIKIRLNQSSFKLAHEGPELIDLDLSFGAKKKSPGSEESLHPPIRKIKMSIGGLPNESGLKEWIEVAPAKSTFTLGLREYSYDYDVVGIDSGDISVIEKEYPDYEIVGCNGPLLPRALLVKYNHTKKIAPYVMGAVCGRNSGLLMRYIGGGSLDVELPPDLFLEISRLIVGERKAFKEALESSQAYKNFLKISLRKNLAENKEIDSIQDDLVNTTFNLSEKTIPGDFLERTTTLSQWTSFLNEMDEKTRRTLVEFIDKHRIVLQGIWYGSIADKEAHVEEYPLKYISYAYKLLRQEFPRSIKYLKPLRNEPSAVYPFMDQEIGTNIGLKGEYTAAVLHANKNKRIRYPKPSLNSNHEFSWTIAQAGLQEACHDWLSYLGVVRKVETADKGKLGYELQVKISEKDQPQDLTHVGVGVSQILPILVMCLLADSDNILVLEQPELHLHPKVQSKLCDFFIAMSGFNRQCLVETHSEYMINRLRLRIAQGDQENIAKESPIYFIEKSENSSKARKVEINRFGVIQDWPEDFFDQSDREVEAILLAAARKELSERKKSASKPSIARRRKGENPDQC